MGRIGYVTPQCTVWPYSIQHAGHMIHPGGLRLASGVLWKGHSSSIQYLQTGKQFSSVLTKPAVISQWCATAWYSPVWFLGFVFSQLAHVPGHFYFIK